MGPGKRGLITAAVAVVCAVTVLTAPGTAFADPGPVPAPTITVTPDLTPAPDSELEAVRERLEQLYREAAAATDAYNAAEEKAERQSKDVVELAEKIVEGREELAALEARAAAAARSQYRTGGLPDEAKLILSDDPQEFLDGAGRVIQGQRAATGLIGETRRAQAALETYAADASEQWRQLEQNREAKATAQQTVEARIKAAKKLESELAREDRERLARLERAAAEAAQSAWLDSGVLDGTDEKATARGAKAVKYATDQIGKPYVWGAEGPASFDCSGLTSRAWAAAGQGIPRTSQEQWRQLARVAVADLRPGDLIVYFDDASHVAMYVGDGMIVHAPRPGRTVTLAGAGTMPILGAVRPEQ